jgi:tetratricopeptide (TPR) repeat protein/KaiC/GvpD/RAD55 family RecA-like ATPase
LASLERGRVPSSRPIAAKEIPLIDRVEEMSVLKEAVDKAVNGEGHLFFLHGEAGIGKTRLTRELGAYARLRGMQVLYGRCPALFRMDGVPPYILWKEVVKDYLETCTPEQLYRVIGYYPVEVSKLVPELKQMLKTVPESFTLSPETSRDRLFEAVSQFITNISREAPLLVILDDLQWTDESSLLLLHYLARGACKESLLLLGAYRDTDVNEKHPLWPVLTELNRERLLQFVLLKRMSFDDVSEMAKQTLEQDEIPKEFCELVYEKTRGNPFFLEEVIRSLKEEDVIFREKNKWKFKQVSGIEFPETVKSVVKARISRLDEESQNVLTLASFIGNDLTYAALSEVTHIEEEKLLEIIEKILKTGLFKHRIIRQEDMLSFADIIVRDVAYEEVSPFRRKKIHGMIGTALEKVYAAKIDEHLGEMALHFLESGDKDKALDYFLKAGEKAAAIYANGEAVSYFRSSLRLLEEKEGGLQERGRVLERLGDIENIIGEHDACIKHWDEALLISAKLQEKQKTATLHRKMANVLWDKIGDKERAKEHHEAALRILEAEPESVELARLYEDIAHMTRRTGEAVKALPWAEKALTLAEKLNAAEAVAVSCIELSICFGVFGDLKKAREYANRALKIALDNNYSETALWAYGRLTDVIESEEYEKCLGYIEKGLALSKKVGDIRHQSDFLGGLAWMNMQMGELGKAVTLQEEALELKKKAGYMTFVPADLLSLGLAYQMLGEWEKSEQYCNEASIAARNLDEFPIKVLTPLCSGLLHFAREKYAKARECFEEGVKVFEKAGGRIEQTWHHQFLAWTYIELGEIERAKDLIDSEQKFARESGEKYHDASEKTLRAMMLRAQRKYEESIELFDVALREWESMNANIWFAYFFARWILCEYARAYLDRDQQGDREKALNLLNRALEMFQKMGAKKDIEKVEARMAFIETGKAVSKPKAIDHVSTGYADLDKLLYGGIPSNCAVVLTSPSCNERDLLIKSFLETGANKGEVAFYVTINPGSAKTLAEEFPSNVCLFVCNPQADAIVRNTPNVVKLKGVENLTDISIALTSAIRKLDPSIKGARRICLDLVSDVLLQHHAVQTRRWLAGLIPELQSEGFTTLAVLDPQVHAPEELHAVLGLFDGEIKIYERETERGSEKFLKIKKMSNQKYLENELHLTKEGQE